MALLLISLMSCYFAFITSMRSLQKKCCELEEVVCALKQCVELVTKVSDQFELVGQDGRVINLVP